MPKSCVVRIFSTSQSPDPSCPWQCHSPIDGGGSGVVLAPNRVLTGAHVVANATFVQVQTITNPDRFIARVHSIDHDSDLALLEVEDPAFMADIETARLGSLPHPQDRVSVVGFPIGGEEISITEGIVSRIEVQCYSHSKRALLAVTVDAAINPGNSGGPVFGADGRVVGIAFQGLDDADNIGEMVPTPIIERFLAGVQEGRRFETPGNGMHTNNLENPTLRRVLGLKSDESGILVREVEYGSSAWGVIEPGDALLAIDGNRIANNGTIRYRDRYRTFFTAIFGEKFIDEKIPLTVRRNGERIELAMELKPLRTLVPDHTHDQEPQWFAFGGLVFQTLTHDYLCTWGEDWADHAPKQLLYLYQSGIRTEERQEIVIVSQVLRDEINFGYGHFTYEVIASVNGHKPIDLADLVSHVDDCQGLLDLRTTEQARLVFDALATRLAGPRILEHYHVPTDRSAGLMQ